MKLIATCVGIGKNSDPICSDAYNGSDLDWSPDDVRIMTTLQGRF